MAKRVFYLSRHALTDLSSSTMYTVSQSISLWYTVAKNLKGSLRNLLDMESLDREEDQQVSVLSTEELATISDGEHVTMEELATTSDGDYVTLSCQRSDGDHRVP